MLLKKKEASRASGVGIGVSGSETEKGRKTTRVLVFF